jgi:hypothetical protein
MLQASEPETPRPGRPTGMMGKKRPRGEISQFCRIRIPVRTVTAVDRWRGDVSREYSRSLAICELLDRALAAELPDFTPASPSLPLRQPCGQPVVPAEPRRRRRGKYRTRPAARNKELIEAYASGVTVVELCERYGLRSPSVYSILQRRADGLSRHHRCMVQERVNQVVAKVDEFIAIAVQQPDPAPPPEPVPESKPDSNEGLDPADPRPWPCETAWVQKHWPNGYSRDVANQLTECFHFLRRYGVPRGTDIYFQLLERRIGIYKPSK